jgi:hypothetical membrane protein
MTAVSQKAGNDMIRDTRRTIPAAIALLVAVVAFFVAETVSAAAWDNPPYSYANDFVSDLGVPGPPVMFKGHLIHSPLAWVLNAGFITNGVLVILVALLLLRPRGHGGLALWQRRLMIVQGLGLIIAATFHEVPAWMFPFHAFGATLIMAGGNGATLLAGLLGARLGLPTWLARTFTVIGAAGFLCFLGVQVDALTVGSTALPPNIGTLERLAAYPLLLAQLAAGVGLLVEAARRRTRTSIPGPMTSAASQPAAMR